MVLIGMRCLLCWRIGYYCFNVVIEYFRIICWLELNLFFLLFFVVVELIVMVVEIQVMVLFLCVVLYFVLVVIVVEEWFVWVEFYFGIFWKDQLSLNVNKIECLLILNLQMIFCWCFLIQFCIEDMLNQNIIIC